MLGPQFAGIAASKVLGASGLLLDDFPNAAAAYSLRKLRSDYSGSAIRARGAGGDTEADIGFDGNDLDETALLNHCGANDGFVVTWYDQSGNGNNATNATAAQQPKIVNAGSVLKENSRPVIDYDGTDDWLTMTVALSTALSWFYIATPSANTDSYQIGSDDLGSSPAIISGYSSLSFEWFHDESGVTSDRETISSSGSGLSLVSVLHSDGSTLQAFYNGTKNVDVTTETSANGKGLNSIGSTKSGGNNADFRHSEFVAYNSDRGSDRANIESNINDYYAIF